MNDLNVVIGPLSGAEGILFSEGFIRMSHIWLPDILVELGLYKSKSQIRRDCPHLLFEVPVGFVEFDDLTYRTIKSKYIFRSVGKKKQSVFILRNSEVDE